MQQINLLNGELLPKSDPLLARHFVYAWAGFLVVLVLMTAWQGVSLWSLQDEMVVAQDQVNRMRQDNAEQRLNNTEPDTLKQTVANLKAKQIEQSQLVALLKTEQETTGFYPLLLALAEARVENVWLEEIRIYQGSGRQVNLAGATTDARLVPELLQRLSEQSALNGQRFQTLDMSISEEEEVLNFAIASPIGGAPG